MAAALSFVLRKPRQSRRRLVLVPVVAMTPLTAAELRALLRAEIATHYGTTEKWRKAKAENVRAARAYGFLNGKEKPSADLLRAMNYEKSIFYKEIQNG